MTDSKDGQVHAWLVGPMADRMGCWMQRWLVRLMARLTGTAAGMPDGMHERLDGWRRNEWITR